MLLAASSVCCFSWVLQSLNLLITAPLSPEASQHERLHYCICEIVIQHMSRGLKCGIITPVAPSLSTISFQRTLGEDSSWCALDSSLV
ncbi:hypothetical protein F5Y19DRAFT_432867 [Xylariaceae sp. FL1651]|nr:hypothetical protein F5Y19DRAFT_432867 [Xylariaceae sp. FL1651]